MRTLLAMSLHAVVLASSVAAASAQTPTAEEDERARLHFESGRAYFEEGSYERAIPEFSSAYELSHRHELLMNIASSLERLGRYGEAADYMDCYLAEAGDIDNRDALERRVANLRARGATSGADDGERHTDGGPGRAADGQSGGSDGPTIGAAVSFGIAGAGVAAFAILGSLALGERSSLENSCAPTCDDSDVSGLRALALGADVGLVVAGVGALAGLAVLLFVSDESTESAPSATAVAPWVTAEGAGVAIGGEL